MTTSPMASPASLQNVKRIGTGLAFVLCPLLFVFAFAVHPGLLSPHRLSEVELILRQHHNALLAFGHVLVLFDAALIIVVTLHLAKLLDRGWPAWAGFIGAVLTVFAAVMLAAEKGAECLTISALDTLSEAQFAQMMPGLVAIFSHQGWMVLVEGVLLLAVGLTLQAIALLATNAIPRWQSAALLGIWLLGWPDGEEIYALAGSVLLSLALVPLGIQMIMAHAGQTGTSETPGLRRPGPDTPALAH
jgi:hypothetical protein